MSEFENQISDLYQRTEATARESALTSQRLDIHERNCTEKHNTVIKKLETLTDDQKTRHKWLMGVLTSLVIALIIAMITK